MSRNIETDTPAVIVGPGHECHVRVGLLCADCRMPLGLGDSICKRIIELNGELRYVYVHEDCKDDIGLTG